MTLTVANQMVETLAAAGVERIYGIVGDSLNGFTDALRRHGGIQWLHVRHEEVAAFAAGAHAHVTGSLAVCGGSCGPGNLHLNTVETLRTFVRVVETGSLTAAAREMNADQSTISRQITQLEEHFGVRLLHRTTFHFSLTDDGQGLHDHARNVLEVVEGRSGQDMHKSLDVWTLVAAEACQVFLLAGFGDGWSVRLMTAVAAGPGSRRRVCGSVRKAL
jgi:hypothetical protein